MNLTLDLGNTRIKAAIFDGDELVSHQAFSHDDELAIEHFILNSGELEHCMICSVIHRPERLFGFLEQHLKVWVLDHHTPLPLKNLYRTPETLGKDRLACAAGAAFLFPRRDVLVVDTGTCIKYEFVSSSGSYEGGAISPGLEMRFNALHTFTDKLPLLHPETGAPLTGKDTREAILAGIMKGALLEIQGFVSEYETFYPELQLIITGGDASFFDKQLKSSIFADPFLILRGLNFILRHNVV
jgi:type III pantothenate kinase